MQSLVFLTYFFQSYQRKTLGGGVGSTHLVRVNTTLLNYSLGGLCHFPAGRYTHAALETV